MIRFLLRFLGLWLLAGAFVALVIDGTRSVSASRFISIPVRDAWALIDPSSLDGIQARFAGGAGEPVIGTFLAMPFFAFLALAGLVFLFAGKRKRADHIGYSSRD
jgi:hypothetical protein